MTGRTRPAGIAIALLALTILLSSCGLDNRLVIGAQTYSEAKILAEMYKALIEDRTDLKAKVLPDLAASGIIINSMKKNEPADCHALYGRDFQQPFPGRRDEAAG